MAKMATRSSPAKRLDMDSVPQSHNLLMNPSSEFCNFTDSEIEGLFTCFPPDIIFRPFDSSMKSDVVSSTWVCFSCFTFPSWLYLSLSDLTQRFFTLTGISYSQAMPMLWRVLHTIEQIIINEGIDFNLSELSYLYSLVTHGSHRFLLKAKPHQPLPILKTIQNDST
ncbi:hypothetical protein HanPI659440_Chr13g0495191 [Helianthus annuus]|nr:hypothetical protein HanPI659440_Chr13g0495191 [Helianthus annuus]